MAWAIVWHDKLLRVFDFTISNESNISSCLFHVADFGNKSAISSLKQDYWKLKGDLVVEYCLLRLFGKHILCKRLASIKIRIWYEDFSELQQKKAISKV